MPPAIKTKGALAGAEFQKVAISDSTRKDRI